MLTLDNFVISWIIKKCSELGSVFGFGAIGGAMCYLLVFLYAYSIGKGGLKK